MPDNNAAFTGSIPENYDRYLGPVLFEPYAADLVARIDLPAGGSVLELACGTGIVTRRLRDRLGPRARLVATDLNAAMLKRAAKKFQPEEMIEWKEVDATDLEFPDEVFDSVVCQFGLMFFPDKSRAIGEAHRVLKRGGQLLFSVWDELGRNDLPRVARAVVTSFFEDNPPDFYDVPFSFCDREQIYLLLHENGFTNIEITTLAKPAVAGSANDVSIGLVEGNPIITAIRERMASRLPEIKHAVASALRGLYGDAPVQANMQALVCSARK